MDCDTLNIPSTPEQIRHLEAYVKQLAHKHKIKEELYPNILISLTEAVNNAIIHGNNKDKNKTVNICFDKTDKCLVFKVTDQGVGFNPKSVPDPTLPENLECCGGRGVFLMKQLSDKVDYQNHGTTVEIWFNLTA